MDGIVSKSPLELADDVPHQIGRYRLAFEFAAGGMATVYLAREAGASGMNRAVALKVIHRHLAQQQDFIDMFLDEAHVASRINHPNVCSVYDFGQSEDGTYYIAMEYLVGETVSRLIRRLAKTNGTSPLLVAQIVADACEGLHAAHELLGPNGEPMGVVHRDVTPSNIYVCYDGTVRIVDFGIAKAANKLHTTRAGQLKGKMSYVSPEQFERSADRRADVWSLGVVFWEALTKKRLFRRDTEPKTLLAVAQAEVPPPSKHCSDLPAGLDEVVLKALERDPDNRYPTARAMGRAIRSVLLKHQVLVGPPEIADLMTGLFPEERAQRLLLVEQTLRVARTRVERVSSVVGEQSNSGVVSDVRLSPSPRPSATSTPVPSPSSTPSLRPSATPLPRPGSSLRPSATPIPRPSSTSPLDQFPALDEYGESDPTHVTDHGVSVDGISVDDVAEPQPVARPTPRPVAPVAAQPVAQPVAVQQPVVKPVAAKPVKPGAAKKSKRSIPLEAWLLVLSLALVGLAIVGLVKWENSSDATATHIPSRLEQPAPVAQPESTATDVVVEDEVNEVPVEEPTVELEEPIVEIEEPTPTRMRRTPRMRAAVEAEPQEIQPVRGPGTALVVIVGGWAQVSVGERSLGRATGRFELPAGRHELTIRPFGMDPAEQRTIEINEGRVTRISVTAMR